MSSEMSLEEFAKSLTPSQREYILLHKQEILVALGGSERADNKNE